MFSIGIQIKTNVQGTITAEEVEDGYLCEGRKGGGERKREVE